MLKADKTYTWNGVRINEFLLTKHNPNRISLPSKMVGNVIGVTLHNTNDLNNVNDDAEQYTRATYNGNMGTARIHFYVDDLGAWQNLPLDYQSWHAGQSGKPAQYGSGKGNSNTISIECIMKSADLSIEENAKARDNSARLIAYLLKKYNLTINNLYTHNYWVNIRNGKTGSVDQLNKLNDGYKGCPLYIRPKWDEFKALVQSYMKETPREPQKATESNFNSYKVKIIADELNVRKTPNWNDSDVVTTVKKGEVFTIVEEKMLDKTKFGKLKSGVGYISLNSKYVETLSSKSSTAFKEYKVKIICDKLNVRKTPKFTQSDIVTTVKKNDVFTIVGETTVNDTKFGKLKSGAGYISLGSTYVKKI